MGALLAVSLGLPLLVSGCGADEQLPAVDGGGGGGGGADLPPALPGNNALLDPSDEIGRYADAVRGLVLKNSDSPTIHRCGLDEGMDSLRDDGSRKVLEGVTTIEEVLAATQDEV